MRVEVPLFGISQYVGHAVVSGYDDEALVVSTIENVKRGMSVSSLAFGNRSFYKFRGLISTHIGRSYFFGLCPVYRICPDT